MGERKVLINYISPDFDPSLIPRQKRNKDRIQEIRMMLPFSMQCNTCSEYLYRGKKFNSRKEDCKGEDYMGIRRFRFYIKCAVCSAEITFKTDPKNTDYECESGAIRTFEVWRDTEEQKEASVLERLQEDEHDSMRALENRTLDSKIEMDVLDALDEIKAINQRHERVDTMKVLERISNKHNDNTDKDKDLLRKQAELADEELIKTIKFKNNDINKDTNIDNNYTTNNNTNTVSNIGLTSMLHQQLQNNNTSASTNATTNNKPVSNIILIKKRKLDTNQNTTNSTTTNNNTTTTTTTTPNTTIATNNNIINDSISNNNMNNTTSLGNLLAGYSDDSD